MFVQMKDYVLFKGAVIRKLRKYMDEIEVSLGKGNSKGLAPFKEEIIKKLWKCIDEIK